jgi:Glycosyl hydrolase family 9
MVAALAQIYSNKLKYFDKIKKGFRRGFQCFAQNQARYLIGTDWNRKSYVVGVGKKGYDHTIHRGASCPAWPAECPPDMRGSNLKDHNVIKGGVLWLPEVCLSCVQDCVSVNAHHRTSYSPFTTKVVMKM